MMNIDSQLVSVFKQVQATYMQNTTLTFWETSQTKDSEGTNRRGIDLNSPAGEFLCNPIEQSSIRIMETYGLTEPFEVALTCDPDVTCGLDSIVKYKDNYYKVTNMVTVPTHKLLVLTKWVLITIPVVSA